MSSVIQLNEWNDMIRASFLAISLLLLFWGIPCRLSASDEYSLTQISYTQGLSNSAVLSMYKDNQGIMWFGTYDGLNSYNGKRMEVFRTDMPLGKPLLNNSIYGIHTAGDNLLWISTQVGVNRFSLKKRQVVGTYQNFKEEFELFSNQKGDTWVVDKEHIYAYSPQKDSFIALASNTESINKNLYLVDEKGRLWQFSESSSQVYHYQIYSNGRLAKESASIHPKKILFSFCQGSSINFVDAEYDLFLYDLEKNRKVYIRNVAALVRQYGKMKGIISFHDDIVLAFEQNGLIKLDVSARYKESVIDNSFRIFCVCKDPVQDIIWVGTDGMGVLAYSTKKRLAVQLMFNQLQNKITRQVRSIYTDTLGNLWFGTKGDGLVKVAHYQDNIRNGINWQDVTVYFPGEQNKLLAYNRRLTEFQVFGIAPSRYRKGFWLGAAENPALSFYDYRRDVVYPVKVYSGSIKKVHQIYEENDSILWMTTAGTGLCRVIVKEQAGGTWVASKLKQFVFKKGKKDINDFFPMSVEGDSIMWLGSRGMGLIRFNFHTEAYKVYQLGGKDKFAVNDILSICPDGKRLYLGTVSGLVQLDFDQNGHPVTSCIGREQGFLNDMIHGILKDESGFLWLSTNKGLVKYNPSNRAFHTFYYTNGLQIGEFSDDAFYRCPQTGNLFFGGINGLLFLEKERMSKVDYHPSILFYGLELEGEPVPFYDYYDERLQALVFRGISQTFSVAFIAPDFIDGDNFEYSYQIDGDEWSPFSTINVASFKSLSCGTHTLRVRYKRDVFDTDYMSYELRIKILPPWYLSLWACFVYLIIIASGVAYLVKLITRHSHRKKLIKELMVHEAYNTSPNSVGASSHELMGAYSAIFQACGDLRKLPDMPESYYQELDRIHESVLSCVFKVGGTGQQSIRLGDYFPARLTVYGAIDVRTLSNEVIRMLIQNGHNNLSDLQVEVEDNLSPILSEDAVRFLLYYVYEQALQAHKTVSVRISQQECQWKIQGEGIPAEICQHLQEIVAQSEVQQEDVEEFGSYLDRWLFVYAIRGLHASLSVDEQRFTLTLPMRQDAGQPEKAAVIVPEGNPRKRVLLLEDRASITWLVKEKLCASYEVVAVPTLQEAFAYLRKCTPDVFLADTLIYLSEEHKFFDYIQANKGLLMHLVFIPMVTWKAARLLDKVSDSLIDGFVVIPYDILFLNKMVDVIVARTSDKKNKLMELLQDSTSAVQAEAGEQNAFMKKLVNILDQNLNREDFGASFLADELSMSSRQFYRKFKDMVGNSPSEFIKAYRIEKAARLLEETDLSVSEVISEVGIASRSYFYKEFSYKYGMTPKEYRDLKKKESSV